MPKHSRKQKRRSLHRKGKKTVKRGGYYSFSGAIAPGAAGWSRESEVGQFVTDRGGNMQYGRGRRRGKRGGKTMKGGQKYGAASASFEGTGYRGIANRVATNTKFPPFGSAKGGEFNNGGAGPGDFAGFKGLFPK